MIRKKELLNFDTAIRVIVYLIDSKQVGTGQVTTTKVVEEATSFGKMLSKAHEKNSLLIAFSGDRNADATAKAINAAVGFDTELLKVEASNTQSAIESLKTLQVSKQPQVVVIVCTQQALSGDDANWVTKNIFGTEIPPTLLGPRAVCSAGDYCVLEKNGSCHYSIF